MWQRVDASGRQLGSLTLILVVALGLLAIAWPAGMTGHASVSGEAYRGSQDVDPGTSIAGTRAFQETAFLPLLARSYPLPPPIYGTEIKSITVNAAN